MRNALPVIREDAAALKQRLHHEQNGRKKSRLQMLYLLASGQAQTRRDVAQLLGVHRNTVGHWLALYATSGLGALLDLYVPLGKPFSLPPDVLAGAGPATAGGFCLLCRTASVDQTNPPPGHQLSHPLHHRPDAI
jgi:hypothetical protein